MKARIQSSILAVLWMMSSQPAMAVAPTSAEMAESRGWAEAKLEKSAEPFFSFTYDGKPSAELLKKWDLTRASRQLDAARTEHTLTYTDPTTGLVLRCVGIEYRDFPTVEWTLYFKNTGKQDTPILADIQALNIRVEGKPGTSSASSSQSEFCLYHHTGCPSTPDDYAPHTQVLGPGFEKRVGGAGGRSTGGSLSYFNLAFPEHDGIIVVVGWPGQWAAQFTRDKEHGLHITAGQELTHFKLLPGEEVRTPLVVLQFWKGDRLRSQNIWRRWMAAHSLPRPGGKPMPPAWMVCTSDYYPGMKSSAAGEIKYAKAHVAAGCIPDYWWIDAGWYPCGSDWSNTGTWEPDPERYPKGLREVADYVHSQGMKFVVWFETERVRPGSWLAKNHPEWVLRGDGDSLLNFGDLAAWQWITNHIDQLITTQGIDLYRQDFNMDPLSNWRRHDAPDRQGITEIKHVTGFLAYWDELVRRHPNMPIDCCSSGGHRNDLEMMRRSFPLLRSDYRFEPNGTQGHTYGMASWIPYNGTGVYIDNVYQVRSHDCAWLGYGQRDPLKPGADWTLMKRMVAEFRTKSAYLDGDYYPLLPYTLSDTVWMAWQFDCPERGKGMVQAFRHAACAAESTTLKLQGLEPDTVYTLTNLDVPGTTEMTGRQLAEGLPVVLKSKPGSAVILYQKKP